jgi:hypothetical protein
MVDTTRTVRNTLSVCSYKPKLPFWSSRRSDQMQDQVEGVLKWVVAF